MRRLLARRAGIMAVARWRRQQQPKYNPRPPVVPAGVNSTSVAGDLPGGGAEVLAVKSDCNDRLVTDGDGGLGCLGDRLDRRERFRL